MLAFLTVNFLPTPDLARDPLTGILRNLGGHVTRGFGTSGACFSGALELECGISV